MQVLRKMLLSFRPDVYEKIKSGVKIFEHRRNFPDEPIMAYMYVSSPVLYTWVKGIVYLTGWNIIKKIAMLLHE